MTTVGSTTAPPRASEARDARRETFADSLLRGWACTDFANDNHFSARALHKPDHEDLGSFAGRSSCCLYCGGRRADGRRNMMRWARSFVWSSMRLVYCCCWWLVVARCSPVGAGSQFFGRIAAIVEFTCVVKQGNRRSSAQAWRWRPMLQRLPCTRRYFNFSGPCCGHRV